MATPTTAAQSSRRLDLIASVQGGDATYYVTDGLGSTTGLVDGDGVLTDFYTYDAFGAARIHLGTSEQPFGFTGEQQDADIDNDLYYLRARFYDPSLGRFWSRDPFTGFASSPQSQNPYTYVGNQPENLVDPWGLCGFRSFGDVADCFTSGAARAGDPAEKLKDLSLDVTYPLRARQPIRLENAFRLASFGDVQSKEGGITLITNCRGACQLVQAPAFTIGHTIFTTQGSISQQTLAHERRHVDQYEILGDSFWVVYGGNAAISLGVCLKNAGPLSGSYYECLRSTNALEVLAR